MKCDVKVGNGVKEIRHHEQSSYKSNGFHFHLW
jgi:hypothetical protein